jgi:hypothetical protein
MAGSYIILSSSVDVTSANNAVSVTIGGVNEVLTLAAGTYYWTGVLDATNLCQALDDAISSHSAAPTITMSRWVAVENPDTPKVRVTISSSAAMQILWTSVDTTLDGSYFGFNSDTISSVSVSSDSDTRGVWAADQPMADETKGPFEIFTDQHRSMSGVVYTFNRSSQMESHGFALDFIAPQLTLTQEKNETAGLSGERRTFENFWSLVSDGKPVRVHKGDENGTYMLAASYETFNSPYYVGEWIFDVDSCSFFSPARYSPGLELYSFPIGLRKKV